MLAVVDQEVGTQHVHRGVGERHVGGERRAPREQHGSEREQIGQQRQREHAAQLAEAPGERARAPTAQREAARCEQHDEIRRGRRERVHVGAQLRQRDQRGGAHRRQQRRRQPPRAAAVNQQPRACAEHREHARIDQRSGEKHRGRADHICRAASGLPHAPGGLRRSATSILIDLVRKQPSTWSRS